MEAVSERLVQLQTLLQIDDANALVWMILREPRYHHLNCFDWLHHLLEWPVRPMNHTAFLLMRPAHGILLMFAACLLR